MSNDTGTNDANFLKAVALITAILSLPIWFPTTFTVLGYVVWPLVYLNALGAGGTFNPMAAMPWYYGDSHVIAALFAAFIAYGFGSARGPQYGKAMLVWWGPLFMLPAWLHFCGLASNLDWDEYKKVNYIEVGCEEHLDEANNWYHECSYVPVRGKKLPNFIEKTETRSIIRSFPYHEK